jgi:hypothetical protein
LNPWEKGVLCLTIGLTFAMLAKLWATGLARIYKLFFCYLVFDLLSSLAALLIPYNTKLYGRVYFTDQTLKRVLAALLLVEIYSLALERHPALSRFGRRAVGYILAAAAVIPVVGLLVDHLKSTKSPYLLAFFLFEQTMDATIGMFLILISLFLAWFPVRLRRNVFVYIVGFIVWLLTRSVAAHLETLWQGDHNANLVINMINMCIVLGCLLLWLTGFRREGESRTAVVGHLWNRAEAERLTRQLDTINNRLEDLRRR